MENLYTSIPGWPSREDQAHNNRLLRKLRIALIFWVVSLVVTLIWFRLDVGSFERGSFKMSDTPDIVNTKDYNHLFGHAPHEPSYVPRRIPENTY